MKFGEVFDYGNAEEAKKYIGKKGLFSDFLKILTEIPSQGFEDTLEKVENEDLCPFCGDDSANFQFFRPILEEGESDVTAEENRGNLGESSPEGGNMKFGEVYDYSTVDKAGEYIGKEGVFSDFLESITERPEGFAPRILKKITLGGSFPFTDGDKDAYQFFRPILEEDDELMTNRQLSEWIAKGNGEFSSEKVVSVFCSSFHYFKKDADKPVEDNTLIRRWNDTEWVKPTKEIYEEDCK